MLSLRLCLPREVELCAVVLIRKTEESKTGEEKMGTREKRGEVGKKIIMVDFLQSFDFVPFSVYMMD